MMSNRYLFTILVICPYFSMAQSHKRDFTIPNILIVHNIKCRAKSKYCTKDQDYPRVVYSRNHLAEGRINKAILMLLILGNAESLLLRMTAKLITR